MNKSWPIPGTLEYNEWFKKNPPIRFDAEVHFVSAGPTGLPFSFPTGQCSFELDYKGTMLICICQDVSGATHFNSGCSYNIKVELPTGAAYDVSLPLGTKVRFVRPPNITVAGCGCWTKIIARIGQWNGYLPLSKGVQNDLPCTP